MTEPLKCPTCVEAGVRSKVYSRGVISTAMGWAPYYDEDGGYHRHDPNTSTAGYACSNGHSFTRVMSPPCPNPNCDYGKPCSEGGPP